MFSRSLGQTKVQTRLIPNMGDSLSRDCVLWAPANEGTGERVDSIVRPPRPPSGDNKTGWHPQPDYIGYGEHWTPPGSSGGRAIIPPTYGNLVVLDSSISEPPTYLNRTRWSWAIRVYGHSNGGCGNSSAWTGNWGWYTNYSGNASFWITNYTDSAKRVQLASSSFSARQGWYHIVGSYDGDVMRLAINGGEAVATVGDLTWTWVSSQALSPSWDSTAWEDFRYWNRALTRDEARRYIHEGPTAGLLKTPSRRFAVTGNSATVYTLPSNFGSFALSGQSANLLKGSLLTSAAGAFTLSGLDANLLKGSLLTSAAGAFTFTGNSATLTYVPVGSYTLTSAAGSYTVTGNGANLLYGRSVTGDVGAFVFTGQSANLLKGSLLTSDAGAISLNGQGANLLRGSKLTSDLGQFILNGQGATLVYTSLNTFVLTASNGSFVLNGQVANLSGPARGIARRTDIVVDPYSRRSLDVGADQTQVIAFLIEELRRVENALRDIGDGASQVADKAPLNPRKGMVRFAVNPWNPGSGDGLYTYTGSAWTKLY